MKLTIITIFILSLALISGCQEKELVAVDFCGESTYGFCNVNEDCSRTGCSLQVCQSNFQEPITTTCEWNECYNHLDYNLECGCVDNQCQWN